MRRNKFYNGLLSLSLTTTNHSRAPKFYLPPLKLPNHSCQPKPEPNRWFSRPQSPTISREMPDQIDQPLTTGQMQINCRNSKTITTSNALLSHLTRTQSAITELKPRVVHATKTISMH